GYLKLVTQLVALMTGQSESGRVWEVLGATSMDDGPATWQLAVLEGWGQGLKIRGIPLHKVWEPANLAAKKKLDLVRPLFAKAAGQARAADLPVAERALAIR